jgi:uncharacterized protein (TIGR02231 family)
MTMTSAIGVELPAARVTLLEDRAQVERRGQVELPQGRSRLRVTGLSPMAVDRSLQVDVAGASVVEVRVVRIWKERPKGGIGPDASALRRQVRQLEDQLEEEAARVARVEARRKVVDEGRADALRGLAEAAGAGVKDPSGTELLARARDESRSSREALREARHALGSIKRRLGEARVALSTAEEPEAALEAAVELVVHAPAAGPAQVKLHYLVPCALWRPCYRATLSTVSQASKPGASATGAPTPGASGKIEVEAQAVVWQRTGETWKDVELLFSTARPSLGAAPPELAADWLSLRDKEPEEKQRVEVELREEHIQSVGQAGLARSAELPGLDDGGEVRTLTAASRATIPSDGLPSRVDLFKFEAPAESELLAAPELSALVSRVARFDNLSGRVLLAGPVDLVRESGFVGRSLLPYAGIGERVKLGFGSEESLRMERQKEESRFEAALTGKKTIRHRVKVFVSNAGAEPQRVVLQERIPVSEVSAVEVKLLPGAEPLPQPSADGILRFDLALTGREHRQIELAYQLTASSKVSGV